MPRQHAKSLTKLPSNVAGINSRPPNALQHLGLGPLAPPSSPAAQPAPAWTWIAGLGEVGCSVPPNSINGVLQHMQGGSPAAHHCTSKHGTCLGHGPGLESNTSLPCSGRLAAAHTHRVLQHRLCETDGQRRCSAAPAVQRCEGNQRAGGETPEPCPFPTRRFFLSVATSIRAGASIPPNPSVGKSNPTRGFLPSCPARPCLVACFGGDKVSSYNTAIGLPRYSSKVRKLREGQLVKRNGASRCGNGSAVGWLCGVIL